MSPCSRSSCAHLGDVGRRVSGLRGGTDGAGGGDVLLLPDLELRDARLELSAYAHARARAAEKRDPRGHPIAMVFLSLLHVNHEQEILSSFG